MNEVTWDIVLHADRSGKIIMKLKKILIGNIKSFPSLLALIHTTLGFKGSLCAEDIILYILAQSALPQAISLSYLLLCKNLHSLVL